MKKLILFFTAITFSIQIVNAQTEFYPIKSEYLASVGIWQTQKNKPDKVVGYVREVRDDVSRGWWVSWFNKVKPTVLFDHFGNEEWNSGWETGFIVLKKGNTSVVLFNYGDYGNEKHATYAIYDAKVLSGRQDYQKKLFDDVYNNKIKSKISYFQKLKKEFNSKEIVALTTKNFESYFK